MPSSSTKRIDDVWLHGLSRPSASRASTCQNRNAARELIVITCTNSLVVMPVTLFSTGLKSAFRETSTSYVTDDPSGSWDGVHRKRTNTSPAVCFTGTSVSSGLMMLGVVGGMLQSWPDESAP